MSWAELAAIVGSSFVLGMAVATAGWFRIDQERRKVLSNWEEGMIITTTKGERLYVCAVERDTDSGGSSHE